MATRKETAEFILDQLDPLPVSTRAMFGEYALYCGDKTVAFICDDTLFMKPTEVGEDLLGSETLAPAYPGSKLYYAVPGDRLENREWLQDLVQRTTEALPAPKPKVKRTLKHPSTS
ncbi:MAG: TfoX/Sxy family protein [Microbacteriaceae bacterium]|nr:TfoX/Sxy family protein [Microbacteriaceae bacterium]